MKYEIMSLLVSSNLIHISVLQKQSLVRMCVFWDGCCVIGLLFPGIWKDWWLYMLGVMQDNKAGRWVGSLNPVTQCGPS